MRHRLKGRHLGRTGAHRRALMRNLCIGLISTFKESGSGAAKIEGRVRTTLHKAKEVRPVVERLVTLGVRASRAKQAAVVLDGGFPRGSAEYDSWRRSSAGFAWAKVRSQYVFRRRQLFDFLRDDVAVCLLIDKIAPRFEDREGGYTRIVRLAAPRLGDAAVRALIEFVGERRKLGVE